MNTITILRAVASYAIAIACFGAICSAQAPNVRLPIFVDRFPTPSTISEVLEQSTAVIRGRVERVDFDTVRNASGSPRDVTRYRIRITDLIKGHVTVAGPTVTVTRSGGEHLSNGKTVRSYEANFEDFRVGNEYVLFLALNTRTGDFDVAFGPDGAFEVSADSSVRPLGHSSIAKAQADTPVTAFVSTLKRGGR